MATTDQPAPPAHAGATHACGYCQTYHAPTRPCSAPTPCPDCGRRRYLSLPHRCEFIAKSDVLPSWD